MGSRKPAGDLYLRVRIGNLPRLPHPSESLDVPFLRSFIYFPLYSLIGELGFGRVHEQVSGQIVDALKEIPTRKIFGLGVVAMSRGVLNSWVRL